MNLLDTQLKDITHQLEVAKARMRSDGKTALKEAFSMFFEKYPEVELICWRQYTPYFNDGDPCCFSKHDFELLPSNLTKDEDGDILVGDGELYDYGYGYGEYLIKPTGEMKSDLAIIEDADKEFFQEVFGDHVEVRVSRAGFQINEFDHD